MRLIFENMDSIVRVDKGEIRYNNKYVGEYYYQRAIVIGRKQRAKEITDEKPMVIPRVLIDRLIPYDSLVVATTKEAIKYNCLHKHLLEKKENNYIIPRKEFTYTKIKGINC